jgi:TRAP transporter TAXI family solute receptor
MKRTPFYPLATVLVSIVLMGFAPGAEAGPTDVRIAKAAAKTTPEPGRKTISWVTYRLGSSSYAQAAGVAGVIQRHSNINVTVEPVGGDLAQIKTIVEKRQAELGYAGNWSLPQARLGTGPYAKMGPQPIRLITDAHALRFGIIVRPGLGINTVADLKGKRIAAVWRVAPLCEILTRAWLEAHGVSPDEVKFTQYAGSAKEMRNLIEGRIDGFFASLGGPKMHELERAGAYVVHMSTAPKVAAYVHSKVPGLIPDVLKDDQPGAKGDTPCYANVESLFTWDGLDDDIAYEIVKAIMEHPEELAKIHPDLAEWKLENFARTMIIPFHPGTIKYYKEKGVWTPQLEAKQKELLAKGR